jgi:hypothetical protein
MASAPTPKYFRPFLQEARDAAAKAKLPAPYFTPRERRDADLVRTTEWRSSDLRVRLDGVAGHWSVYFSYQFQNLSGATTQLVGTSFGLNVTGVPLAKNGVVTLVRYDYDRLLDPRDESVACHLNVLQPEPIGDHIHLPGFRKEPWAASDVTGWVTSSRLLRDLQRRFPT